MTVESASSAPALSGSSAVNRANALGSEAFLKLLVVQLQHQDPTSPQSNAEFVAQLAQFSSLEQLTSINKSVTTMAQLLAAAQAGTPVNADSPSATERQV